MHWVTFLCRTSHVKVPQITQVFTTKGSLSRWIAASRCSCAPEGRSMLRSLVLDPYPQNSSSGSSERIPSHRTVATSFAPHSTPSSIILRPWISTSLYTVVSRHVKPSAQAVYTLHKREARRMGFGEDNAHQGQTPCRNVTKIAHLPCSELKSLTIPHPSASDWRNQIRELCRRPLSKETSPSRHSLPKNRSATTQTMALYKQALPKG